MKKLIIATLILSGISLTGFSQNQEKTLEAVVTEKAQISSSAYIYKVHDSSTGISYETLPTAAQKAIGERIVVVVSGNGKSAKVRYTGVTPVLTENITVD